MDPSGASATPAGPLKRTLRLIRPFIPGNRLLAAGGMTALLAEVIFRVLEPWPTKFVIDAVTRSLGADLAGAGPSASMPLLLACGAALLVIVSLRAFTNYLATLAFALVGSRVATRLRSHVFDHVQSLSYVYYSKARSGDIVQRLVGDVGKLQDVAVTAGLPLLANVLTLVVMSGVMLWLDPLLSLVVFIAGFLYFLFSRTSTGAITNAARRTRKGEGNLANIAQESLTSLRIVQMYGLESHVARTFSGNNERSLKDGVQAKRLAAGLERKTDVIVGLATAVILVAGGWRVASQVMTPGDLVIYLTYLKTAMKPLRDMAKYTGRIASAAASGERVADLLDVVPEIADTPHAISVARVRGDLLLRDVALGYGQRDILRGLSLSIAAGEHIAIVGPSGSGKSTLSLALCRLIEPSSGRIELDGVDIRNMTLASLRSHIALVPQEAVLFSETVRNNIRFGRPGASDADVEWAARQASADDFIRRLPEGYETVLGERGGTLSGGQRQRIAIARAILRDSEIVVLDEVTTGLDPHSANEVLSALTGLTTGRTTISITHDAAVARRATRIVWIEDGEILLDGSPIELGASTGNRFGRWLQAQEKRSDHDAA